MTVCPKRSLKPSGILDTLDMSRDCLGTLVENHKLATVAGYYGIDAKFHSAIEDIRQGNRMKKKKKYVIIDQKELVNNDKIL